MINDTVYEIFFAGDTLDDLDLLDRHREIEKLLLAHVCEVVFTKLNGETRTMPCTLIPNKLPISEGKSTRPLKTGNMSVWCTDKNEWRSFKVANVRKVTVTEF